MYNLIDFNGRVKDPMPCCPICGEECETLYFSAYEPDNPVACDCCVSTLPISDELDIDEPYCCPICEETYRAGLDVTVYYDSNGEMIGCENCVVTGYAYDYFREE